MRVVPKVATPLSELELARVLRDGHIRAFDAHPDEDRLGVAWAHNALEHARGRAIYGSNIGNVTAGSSWSGDVYELRVQERIHRDPDEWKWLVLRFRVHPNAVAGAADYWRLLARRFASVLPLFDDGRAHEAAYRLSVLGYYTALAEPYADAMESLLASYHRAIGPVLEREDAELTAGEQAAVAAVVDRVARIVDEARAGVEGLRSFERAWPRRVVEVPAMP
jgi:hypothetical protein